MFVTLTFVTLLMSGVGQAQQLQQQQQQQIEITPATVEAWLVEAERLRTHSPPDVAQLLKQIEAQPQLLTTQQSHRIQLLKAHQLLIKGKFSETQEVLEQVQASPMHPNHHVRSLYLLAKVSELQGDYEQAFVYLNRAVQLPENELSTDARIDVLLLSADLFAKAQAYTLAVNFAKEALVIAKQTDAEFECVVTTALAVAYREQGAIEPAMKASREQVAACENDDKRIFLAIGQMSIGQLLVQQQQLTRAYPWIVKAKANFDTVGYTNGIIRTNIFLANLLLKQGKLTPAQALLTESIKQAESENTWDELVRAYPIAAEIAEQQGHFQQANAFHKQFHAANEKVRNNQKTIRLAYLQNQFRVEQDKRKHSIEDKEKQLIVVTQENQYLWTVIILLGWGLGISIAVALYLRVKLKKRAATPSWTPIDNVTGLLKYRVATERAATLYQQCVSEGVSFLVLVADINDLDTINTRFGPDVGDILVRAVAERLQSHSPESALIANSAAVQFWLFLPGISEERGNALIDMYRDEVSHITIDGRQIETSMSFGLACGDSDMSLKELMNRARAAENQDNDA